LRVPPSVKRIDDHNPEASMQQRSASFTRESALTDVGLIAGAAALTAVCAQISFGYPVPTTLQTFAVFASAALLGARRAVAGQLLYLGVGAVGLPVFADGHSGVSWLTSADPLHASGGFLWGFVLGAAIVGVASDRLGRNFYITVPAMLLGSVAVYAVGLTWLHAAIPVPWTGVGATVLHYGLWPFVVGDIAKILAAAAAADSNAPWAPLVDRFVPRNSGV
jgi:biotin transport system substrate-specific component